MLNKTLHKIHLQAVLEWGNHWRLIHESILNTINQEAERKYKLLAKKMNRLINTPKTRNRL